MYSYSLKHKHIHRYTHYKQISVMTRIYVHAQKHIYTDICKDIHMYTDTQRYIHTLLVLFSWRTVISIFSVIVEIWPIWWVMEVQVMKRLYLLEGGFREVGGSGQRSDLQSWLSHPNTDESCCKLVLFMFCNLRWKYLSPPVTSISEQIQAMSTCSITAQFVDRFFDSILAHLQCTSAVPLSNTVTQQSHFLHFQTRHRVPFQKSRHLIQRKQVTISVPVMYEVHMSGHNIPQSFMLRCSWSLTEVTTFFNYQGVNTLKTQTDKNESSFYYSLGLALKI